MKPDKITELVDEGVTISRRMKNDSARLKEIKERLIEVGAGSFQGADGKASVSLPGPSLKPDAEAIEAVGKLVDRKTFLKLFEANVVLTPVKSFREVATAILTAAKAKKVIALCEVESAPQVKFV